MEVFYNIEKKDQVWSIDAVTIDGKNYGTNIKASQTDAIVNFLMWILDVCPDEDRHVQLVGWNNRFTGDLNIQRVLNLLGLEWSIFFTPVSLDLKTAYMVAFPHESSVSDVPNEKQRKHLAHWVASDVEHLGRNVSNTIRDVYIHLKNYQSKVAMEKQTAIGSTAN